MSRRLRIGWPRSSAVRVTGVPGARSSTYFENSGAPVGEACSIGVLWLSRLIAT